MYNQFFGIERDPFNLTADPEFLYLTAQHREALAGLSYAILARKGFVVLTGTAGTGKTTLVTRVLGHLPGTRVQSSLILNPTLSPAEFLEAVLLDFGLSEIPASKAQRIAKLRHFLCTVNQAGQISALIVDEAHKLSLEVLEEIRLLGNFESTTEKLLQIALVGQGELDDLLNSERLWQLKQRIARRIAIEPLSAEEVGPYIQHRWSIAGGKEPPFSAEAVAAVARATHGIPRLINVACDNALIDAFAEESALVEARHIVGVCRDLRWPVPAALESAPLVPSPPAPLPQTSPAARPEPLPEPLPVPEEPAAVWAVDAYPMKTLERYNSAARPPSLFGRIRNKMRWRTETA